MSPEQALVVVRILIFGGVLLLVGTVMFGRIIASPAIALELSKALRKLEFLACAGTIVGLAIWLPLEAAEIGDGWFSAFDATILSGFVFETWLGRVWCVQVCLALFQCGLTISDRRLSTLVALAGPLALALSFGLAGHGSSLQGIWGEILPVLLGIHILSAGAWVGALPGLLLALRRASAAQRRAELMRMVNRFSALAQVSALVVIVSGLASLRLIVGAWPVDLSTPYNLWLASKMAVVAMMLGLGALNRFNLTPGLRSENVPVAMQWLQRSVALDIVLSLAALSLVAQLGATMPMR